VGKLSQVEVYIMLQSEVLAEEEDVPYEGSERDEDT
jgi:hypothetical protein